jgi:hypothetical protein
LLNPLCIDPAVGPSEFVRRIATLEILVVEAIAPLVSTAWNGRLTAPPMRESNKGAILTVFDAPRVDILNGNNPGATMR